MPSFGAVRGINHACGPEPGGVLPFETPPTGGVRGGSMSPFPFHGILRFEHLFVPLLVGVLAGSPTPALSQTATAAEGDSAAAASDSLGPDSSSVAPLRVHLEGGYVLSASRVTALPNGLLRIVGADGSTRHVSLARVKRIEDENGNDRFLEVMDSGKTLRQGSPPPPVQARRPKRWRTFQFEPAPRSECGGFMVTEVEWLRRVEGASHVSGDAWYERLDLGAMRNMGPRIALGGTAFLHGSANQGQLGLEARWRYWVSRQVGLDVAPGVIFLSEQSSGPDFRGPGVVARIGVTAADIVGLSVQITSVRFRPDPYRARPAYERSVSVGLLWGSYCGVSAALVSLVGSAISALK